MENNQIRQRVLASTMLEQFQFFQPKNIDAPFVDDSIITWGNYSFFNDIYPDVYKILIENSPTATSVLNRISDFITCNLNKEVRNKLTTKKLDWSNTLGNQIDNIARDMTTWQDSFAIWVGYDKEFLKQQKLVINEFKRLPVHWLRYFQINEDLKKIYDISDDFFIGQKSCLVSEKDNDNKFDLYFQFNPNFDYFEILKQIKLLNDIKQDKSFLDLLPKNCSLKMGQILWINNSDEQMYPNCVFDGMLQMLLSDIGLDSGIASFLANGKIAQTFMKNEASSGAEMANEIKTGLMTANMNGIINGDQMDQLNNTFGSSFLNSFNSGFGTGYDAAGVLGMGSTISVRIQDEESISNFIQNMDCPKFIDEFRKIQDHINEKIANRLQVPYEYIFRMKAGAVNQDNRQTFLEELNVRFDKQRDTIEYVFNNLILENSIYDFRISLKGFGEDKNNINQELKQ